MRPCPEPDAVRTYVRAQATPRSCTPISTRSFASVEQRDDPRLPARPSRHRRMGVVLAASYEAQPTACTRRCPAGARRLCPHAVVVSPRMSAYLRRARRSTASSTTTPPSVEGSRSTRRSSTCAACNGLAGSPGRDRGAPEAERARTGRPADHRRRRADEVPAKVASGVAKPDGLLLVPPDRELAFLHPLDVERL